jgi:protein phosphatase
MAGKMDCFGLTDAGRVRAVNEDQFLIADLTKSMLIHQTSLSHDDHTRLFGGSQGKLLLVADGMGGHAAGKQASTVAVQAVADYVLNTMPWFFRLQPDAEEDLQDELRASLEACQKRVQTAAAAVPERRGMGSTLTMAYILWPRLYVVHAGDSRCYLLRGNWLEQITTDHTIAQRMVEAGEMRAEDAPRSRASHMLWNCIGGGSSDLTVDVYKATLHIGDALLLCSDGLSGMLGDAKMREVLRKAGGARQACEELVRLANGEGGKDNITAVVAFFRDAAARLMQEEATAEETLVRDGEAVRGEPEVLAVGAGEAGLATPV